MSPRWTDARPSSWPSRRPFGAARRCPVPQALHRVPARRGGLAGRTLAPRLQHLGTHTFQVTTTSEKAQAFISQGLNLSYGFNHAEAGRAFREAARLDPDCAMAYWGQALVLGPNINAAMDPAAKPRPSRRHSGTALAVRASPRERAYIEALAKRYVPMFSPNTMASVLRIAPESLAGEIAAARKDFDRAVAHLDRAVRLEDGLVYTEPSEWVYPTRHQLGAVLLAAGRPHEAETGTGTI